MTASRRERPGAAVHIDERATAGAAVMDGTDGDLRLAGRDRRGRPALDELRGHGGAEHSPACSRAPSPGWTADSAPDSTPKDSGDPRGLVPRSAGLSSPGSTSAAPGRPVQIGVRGGRRVRLRRSRATTGPPPTSWTRTMCARGAGTTAGSSTPTRSRMWRRDETYVKGADRWRCLHRAGNRPSVHPSLPGFPVAIGQDLRRPGWTAEWSGRRRVVAPGRSEPRGKMGRVQIGMLGSLEVRTDDGLLADVPGAGCAGC